MYMLANASERLADVLVSPTTSIKDAIEKLERAGTGALLVCGDGGGLLGTLTDGDIRRAILRGCPLTDACMPVANSSPVIGTTCMTKEDLLFLMDNSREYVLNHIPVVDPDGRVTALVMRSDLVSEEQVKLGALIMAGGFGTRLLPLTEHVPKPMLPVGNQPMMELTIRRLRQAGIRHVSVTVHHLAEVIRDHFGDGHSFDIELDYLHEDKPLGTAGGLKLMKDLNEPLLVINGDVLTNLNYRSMLEFHQSHRADITVAVRRFELEVPYGVIDCEGDRISGLREKPRVNFLVNAGIYLLQPSVQNYVPEKCRFDMTDLIQKLIQEGRTVVSFPIVEYWLDIGSHANYKLANKDVNSDGCLISTS